MHKSDKNRSLTSSAGINKGIHATIMPAKVILLMRVPGLNCNKTGKRMVYDVISKHHDAVMADTAALDSTFQTVIYLIKRNCLRMFLIPMVSMHRV